MLSLSFRFYIKEPSKYMTIDNTYQIPASGKK